MILLPVRTTYYKDLWKRHCFTSEHLRCIIYTHGFMYKAKEKKISLTGTYCNRFRSGFCRGAERSEISHWPLVKHFRTFIMCCIWYRSHCLFSRPVSTQSRNALIFIISLITCLSQFSFYVSLFSRSHQITENREVIHNQCIVKYFTSNLFFLLLFLHTYTWKNLDGYGYLDRAGVWETKGVCVCQCAFYMLYVVMV